MKFNPMLLDGRKSVHVKRNNKMLYLPVAFDAFDTWAKSLFSFFSTSLDVLRKIAIDYVIENRSPITSIAS